MEGVTTNACFRGPWQWYSSFAWLSSKVFSWN